MKLQSSKSRITAGVVAIALQALLGYALILGLAVHSPGAVPGGLKLFAVAPKPPPPPRIVPRPIKAHRPRGAAAPPNLKAKATEIVAPPPIVPPVLPPPVIAATTAGLGSQARAGAAPVAGPGSGAGGQGNGTGAGGAGDGEGGDDETPPRWRKGRIGYSDYPQAALDAGVGGVVSIRYVVRTNGRVTDCRVTRSSGNAELDQATCRLIEQRFRFDPSRDADGRPVDSMLVENHEWTPHPDPGDAEP